MNLEFITAGGNRSFIPITYKKVGMENLTGINKTPVYLYGVASINFLTALSCQKKEALY